MFDQAAVPLANQIPMSFVAPDNDTVTCWGGVVRQCAKAGANITRAPAPTVPGPRPAHRPEHTSVAMDPAEVLRQAGVSVSREFDFGPALPFTMGTVGSDSEFQDCASPTASDSGLMSTISD